MKIAFAAFGPLHLPWREQGTAMEILTYELSCHIAEKNDVIVYTQRDKGQKKYEFHKGVYFRRLSTLADKWYLFLSSTINDFFPGFSRARAKKPFFSSKYYYFFYAIQIAQDLRKQKCDILHLHNFSQFVPIFRAYNPDIKIVLHMHAEWLSQLNKSMIEKQLRDVDLVISCSDYLSEKIRKRFPKLSDVCLTLHNGVDINKFNSVEKDDVRKNMDVKKLLFVGRNSPEKGVHVLLNAFNEVVKKYPQVELEIVGPHGSAPIMQGRELILNLTDDLKVANLAPHYSRNYLTESRSDLPEDVRNRISYAGFVKRDKLIEHYQSADIFVFPAVWEEPFGMPVVEAMATGTPVVSTRVGGVKEIVVDGKTGMLVEPGNDSALAQAILCLLEDRDLRKSMGLAARKRADKYFSWESLSRILLSYYKNILVSK